MQHAFCPIATVSTDHGKQDQSYARKVVTAEKNCHKPVGLLICQISQVPNKFHQPLASDLWLNSQTAHL
jgi:hypothetical protein